MNPVEIEEAISLLAEQPFDPDEFPYAFLEAFGNKATTIKRLKSGNNNKSDIENGVLQHNHIHIAVCGEDQVTDTLEDFVRAWLDQEAERPEWKQYKENSKQLALF